jgi:hypothetical protein
MLTALAITRDLRRQVKESGQTSAVAAGGDARAVTEPMDATWRVELLDGEKLLRTEERSWRICPQPTFQTPAGLDLAVYDPAGATADALKKLGI